ncbi:MAG: ribosome maturation factor RimP [Christensenellales bacterium]
MITRNGYEYVGTEIKKTPGGIELIIYADKPGGLTLEDCEKISRLVDPVIEDNDPIADSYFLCVSSPGLDRPLKGPRDFARSVNKKVDVKLYRAINGKKEITGVLVSYNDTAFMLDNGGEFAYKDVALVRLHVDI